MGFAFMTDCFERSYFKVLELECFRMFLPHSSSHTYSHTLAISHRLKKMHQKVLCVILLFFVIVFVLFCFVFPSMACKIVCVCVCVSVSVSQLGIGQSMKYTGVYSLELLV